MPEYSFGDQAQLRILKANVDPFIRIRDLTPVLIPHMKLSRIDHRGVEIIYMLAYQGRYLGMDETLAGAGIMPGDHIDIVARSMDMGAVARHEREWSDYEDLLQLHEANRNVFDLEVRGRAYDDAPLGYRMTFKGVAGPVVDMSRVERVSAPPLTDASGELILAEQFTVEVFILERYPFIEPPFFYVDPIPFHTNVNPFTRKACLYEHWRPVNSLAETVQRYIEQISHLAPSAVGVHVLNFAAEPWMEQYRSTHPGKVPFKNKLGQGPPSLHRIVDMTMPNPPADDDFDPNFVPTITAPS